ncbi:hypothetical protein [Halorubrum sp. AJ67]|uniref:hypothetical protein n=1 Tax=Halorubrum sp. AJ67 TaxID=1173487 RepID=UPI0003DC6E19|nr:hypothetical protein [Halorubrum sp. AJ67]CDK38083.1 hypothetical protein BN903_283 [Halorubrum sp. AJ67]
MSFIDTEDHEHATLIETRHNRLATEHGRDNVFITEINGEVVTLIGDGVGTVDPLDVSVTKLTDGIEHDGHRVEPALVPLFEEPVPWFEGHHDLFELAAGRTGRVCTLSPDGILFLDFGARRFYEDRIERYETAEAVDGVPIVASEDEALANEKHSTWLSIDDTSVWTYEYVPFIDPVQTTAQLQTQLNRILETPPEWDALFESTTDIFERELAGEHAQA